MSLCVHLRSRINTTSYIHGYPLRCYAVHAFLLFTNRKKCFPLCRAMLACYLSCMYLVFVKSVKPASKSAVLPMKSICPCLVLFILRATPFVRSRLALVPVLFLLCMLPIFLSMPCLWKCPFTFLRFGKRKQKRRRLGSLLPIAECAVRYMKQPEAKRKE